MKSALNPNRVSTLIRFAITMSINRQILSVYAKFN